MALATQNMLMEINARVYEKCFNGLTNYTPTPESKEYEACIFRLNAQRIICRTAKITPKKSGQFVTFWQRNKAGITAPFNQLDAFDFFVINVQSEEQLGQFVFPKSVLIVKGIVSTEKKDGKRGFRVYPPWDNVASKQAIKTQHWQLNYFYSVENNLDCSLVKNRFSAV